MCGLQPIYMAAKVSRIKDEGRAVHIITVSHCICIFRANCKSLQHTLLTFWNLCISVDSPVIQKIRQDCSKQFVEFERCLRENQDKPTSCSPHVARFVGCAETVDISGVGKSRVELAGHNPRSHINS